MIAASGIASGATSSDSHSVSTCHSAGEAPPVEAAGERPEPQRQRRQAGDLGDERDRRAAEREPDDRVHDQPLQVLPGLRVPQRRRQAREERVAAVVAVAPAQRRAEHERGVAPVEVRERPERHRADQHHRQPDDEHRERQREADRGDPQRQREARRCRGRWPGSAGRGPPAPRSGGSARTSWGRPSACIATRRCDRRRPSIIPARRDPPAARGASPEQRDGGRQGDPAHDRRVEQDRDARARRRAACCRRTASWRRWRTRRPSRSQHW